jgi:AraC-like DNA-binding protein
MGQPPHGQPAAAALNRSQVRRWHLPGLEQVRHRQPGQEWVPHWHEEWSFGAIVQGECRFSLEGQPVRVRAGDCLAIAPGRVHTGSLVAGPQGVLVVMLYAPPDWMRRHHLPGPGTCWLHDPALVRAATSVGDPADAQAWLAECAGLLAREGHAFPVTGARPTDAAQRMLARLQETVCAGTRAVAEAAHHCEVSRERLHRVVRRWTGLSPAQYMRVLRLNRARELLLDGEPVSQAAAACGFADQAHFIRWFARAFGYTPGALARAQRD